MIPASNAGFSLYKKAGSKCLPAANCYLVMKFISGAPDVVNEFLIFFLNFLANIADIDHDGPAVSRQAFFLPDQFKELIHAEHPLRAADQCKQDIEFLGRHIHRLTVQLHSSGSFIHLESTTFIDRISLCFCLASPSLSSQMSLDTGNQLPGIKRFGDIVISAYRQGDDLIDFLGFTAHK